MTKMHRGQLKAVTEYVKSISVEKAYLSLNGEHFRTFEKQILNVAPWRDLLNISDLFTILHNVTSNFGKHISEQAKGFNGRLDQSPISNLIPEIETKLITFLESLPRPYCVCFHLPKFLKSGSASINLAQNVSLLDTSAPDFNEQLLRPQNAMVEVLAEPSSKKFERDSAYVEFFIPGYASYSLSSFSLARAYSRFKELMFLGIHTNIIREKGSGSLFDFNQDAPFQSTYGLHALVYNRDDISECYRVSLPDDASKYLRWLYIDEANLEVYVPGKTLLTPTRKTAETTEEKASALREEFRLAAEFLDIDHNNTNAERIRTAIEWYFDADISENETVSFIQRCIGLEAILGVKGDDQIRSITDRLSDRYSYLLGNTASERATLKDNFKQMYAKRSDLVHARRSVLSVGDETLGFESKKMLNSVVVKEVNGLLKTLRELKKKEGSI